MRKERIVTVLCVVGEGFTQDFFLRDGATLFASSRAFQFQGDDAHNEGVEWKAHFDQFIKTR